MPISAAGSDTPMPLSVRGFTLLELLIVIALIAGVASGIGLSLRENSTDDLLREGQRLAALLESARAQSRVRGVTVYWHAHETGFEFQGLPAKSLPRQWLNRNTRARPAKPIVLGPDPLIPPSAVALYREGTPGLVWVTSDGLRPFKVQYSASVGRPQ